jgi:hypothetical protein
MSGTLVAPTGEALAGVTIEASVEPNAQQMADFPAGQEVSTVPIGSAVTTSEGAFSLTTTNAEAAAEAVDDESIVAIVVSAETPRGQLLFRTRLVYSDPAAFQAYQPDVDVDLAEAEPTRSRITGVHSGFGTVELALVTTSVTPNQEVVQPAPAAAELGSNASKNDEPEEAPESPDLPETVPVDSPRTDRPEYDPPTLQQRVKMSGMSDKEAAARGGFDPDVWCGGNHWYRKKSRDTVARNVAIFDQATASKTKGAFNYEVTKGTSLEIGVTNRAGSLVTTLGMSKGKNSSVSLESTIGRNVKAQWWVSYRFNIYDVMCDNAAGTKWWSGYSEYRPKSFDGSSSRRLWTPFRCNTTHERGLGPGYTASISKGKTATKTRAFAMGNGDLKASQAWGSSATMKFLAKNSSTSYSLCSDKKIWSSGVSRVRQT